MSDPTSPPGMKTPDEEREAQFAVFIMITFIFIFFSILSHFIRR